MKLKKQMMLDYLKGACIDDRWLEKGTIYRILKTIVESIKSLPAFICILFNNGAFIRQVELVVTTKCSLRCKDCANLMQYYEKPYDINVNDLITITELFLAKIDKIRDFRIIGGEPFVYRELESVLMTVIKSPKVEKITFFTNGTIIPSSSELTKLLSNDKVRVWISDYGLRQQKIDQFVKYCQDHRINCYVKNDTLIWGYVGEPTAHGRPKEELQKQFEQCNNICRSILNGCLYYCPRQGHLDDLGFKKSEKGEVLAINDATSKRDIIEYIYREHHIGACDYCNYGTKEMVPIKPGIQKEK